MELILAILGAGPIGFFTKTRTAGLITYLIAWAVVFPIQTVVVFHESGDDNNVWYFVLNTAILCGGIGLNRLCSILRERRAALQEVAAEAA
jgi:hypothetical protein